MKQHSTVQGWLETATDVRNSTIARGVLWIRTSLSRISNTRELESRPPPTSKVGHATILYAPSHYKRNCALPLYNNKYENRKTDQQHLLYLRTQHQCVHTLVVALADICSSRHEDFNHLFVPLLCCTHKRCRPLLVGLINQSICFHQKLDDLRVSCGSKAC